MGKTNGGRDGAGATVFIGMGLNVPGGFKVAVGDGVSKFEVSGTKLFVEVTAVDGGGNVLVGCCTVLRASGGEGAETVGNVVNVVNGGKVTVAILAVLGLLIKIGTHPVTSPGGAAVGALVKGGKKKSPVFGGGQTG